MSLAAISRRGSLLNWRFAVNGIQNESRSFGAVGVLIRATDDDMVLLARQRLFGGMPLNADGLGYGGMGDFAAMNIQSRAQAGIGGERGQSVAGDRQPVGQRRIVERMAGGQRHRA